MQPKIEKNMWCENCDMDFITDDYLNCEKCPNCDIEPVSFVRTDSTAFVYAYLAKHPENKLKI